MFFGCFPLERARRGKDRMPPTLIEQALLTVTTQVRRNRYDLTPLLRAERIDEAMGVLFRAVRDCRIPGAPKLLRFEALSADGPVEASLYSAARTLQVPLFVAKSWTRPVVYWREDGEYSLGPDGKRKNDKRILTYQRRLGELLGGDVRLVDRSEDPEAIDELFRLERSGYKFANGVATESWSGEPQWLRATCDEFRKSGRLIVCALESGGVTAAVLVMFRGGDRLFLMFKAYDEQLRHFNPGLQLDLAFFDYFHRLAGVQMIDSCTGESNEKTWRLYPQSRGVVTVIASVGGRRYGLLVASFGYLRDRLRLRERVRRLTTRHSWLDRLVHRIADLLGVH